jgi:hypothetical protein
MTTGWRRGHPGSVTGPSSAERRVPRGPGAQRISTEAAQPQGGLERSKVMPRGSTRADAEAFERRVMNLKRLGYDPHQELERGRETLADFTVEWWERYAGRNLARETSSGMRRSGTRTCATVWATTGCAS